MLKHVLLLLQLLDAFGLHLSSIPCKISMRATDRSEHSTGPSTTHTSRYGASAARAGAPLSGKARMLYPRSLGGRIVAGILQCPNLVSCIQQTPASMPVAGGMSMLLWWKDGQKVPSMMKMPFTAMHPTGMQDDMRNRQRSFACSSRMSKQAGEMVLGCCAGTMQFPVMILSIPKLVAPT